MDGIRAQIARLEDTSDAAAAIPFWRRALESIRRNIGRFQVDEEDEWTALRLRVLEGLAHAYWIVGRWDDALAEWEECLTLASTCDLRRPMIAARLGSFEIFNAMGQTRMARTCLAAAAQLLEDQEDDDLMVLTAVLQSSVASKSGQTGTAEQLLRTAQRAAVKLQEMPTARRAQSRAAVEEAVALMRKGDYEGSLHRLTIAIEVLGNDKGPERVEALRFVGVVLGLQGRRAESMDYFQRALALCIEIGWRLGKAKICNSVGQAFMECSQAALAIHCFEQGLRICDEIGARVEGAALLGKLGQAYLQEERFADATRIFQRDLEMSRGSGNIRVLGHSHLNLGRSLSGGRTDDEALVAFREAVRCFEQVDDRLNLGRALMDLCKTQIRLGDFAEAEHAARTALGILQGLKVPAREAQALALVATTQRHAGRVDEALAGFEAAAKLFDQVGPSSENAYCRFEYGRALLAARQKDAAIAQFGKAVQMAVQLGLRQATTRYLESLSSADDASALGALMTTVVGAVPEPLPAEQPTAPA